MPSPQAAHFQLFSSIFLCENGEADILVESHEFRNLALKKTVKSFELHDGIMRNLRTKTANKQSCCWFWQQSFCMLKIHQFHWSYPLQRSETKIVIWIYEIKMMLELLLSILESLSCARGCTVTWHVHTDILHLLIDRLAQMESQECSPGVPKCMG